MKTIKIADMTLRKAVKNPDMLLGFREKIEIAKQLDRLNVDIIEMPELSGDKADELLVKSIASVLKNSTLSVVAGLTEKSAAAAWNAMSGAARPRLNVVVPVSAVQMEYVCKKKPPQVLELISKLVSFCASFCPDVEFSAADATRSDRDFLASAVSAAIKAGAKTVTFCDSIGTMFPNEIEVFLNDVRSRIARLETVEYAMQCSNEIKMAAACAFASVSAGVSIIKTTVCDSKTPTIDAVAHTIRLRGDTLGIRTNVNVTELISVINRLIPQIKTKRSESSPFDNGVADTAAEDIMLDSGTSISTLIGVISKLGYNLSQDDNAKVYESFMSVAKEKQSVGAKELDAIIASAAHQVPPTYKLVSYVINCGNVLTPTANITLEKNGVTYNGLSTGDGPIDAAFLAIEKITGHHYELDDFQIQSVTEGREAMGDALVKLRSDGELYSGKGISTDIIGASIRAYVNALNKIVYDTDNA